MSYSPKKDALEDAVDSVYQKLDRESRSLSNNEEQLITFNGELEGYGQEKNLEEDILEEISNEKLKIKYFPCSSFQMKWIKYIFGYLNTIEQIKLIFTSNKIRILTSELFCNHNRTLDLSHFWLFLSSETPFDIIKSFCDNYLKMFKKVTKINLSHCKFLNDENFEYIIESICNSNSNCSKNRNNENIKSLNLYGCSELTDKALKTIVKLTPKVQTLTLARCYNITKNGVQNALSGLKLLSFLSLMHIRHLPLHVLDIVVKSKSIKVIDIRGCFLNIRENHSIIEQYLKENKQCKIIYKSNIGTMKKESLVLS